MEELSIKSKKLSMQKKFKIFYIIIGCLIALGLVLSVITYGSYTKAQDLGIASMQIADDEWDPDNFDSRAELVEELYDYLSDRGYTSYTPYGNYKYPSHAEVDRNLGTILDNSGYDCYYGSEYFEHSNYISYAMSKYIVYNIFVLLIIIVAFILTLKYKSDKKTSISIDGNTVTCVKSNGKTIQFNIFDIKTVEMTKLNGLKIIGNGINLKFILIENNLEIKDAIIKTITANNKPIV